MPTYYPDLLKLMRAHGCEQRPGGKGSHEKWWSPITGRVVIVPRTNSRHTANSVLKDLGIDAKF
jgi:predicted RNA binding protein YcfA (HicA-like mRNA interferase family)